jgi:hypothetical protein
MPKSLNFVHEWIGPQGPITNNRLPTIADFSYAQFRVQEGDLVQNPFFYDMFNNYNIVPAFKIPDGKFIYEMNFSAYHYRNWIQMFADTYAQGIRSNSVKQGISEGKGYLLITIPFEGWVHDKMFDAMYNHFEATGFPIQQVVYVSNCQNGNEIYQDYCARKGKTPLMNIEYIPTCRIHKTGVEEPIRNRENNPYIPGPRQKDFLCFQRRYNDHRLLFFMNMWKKGLLGNFYMSMAKEQPEAGRSYNSNISYVAHRYPEFNITEADIVASETVLPLTLDTHNFNVYPMESSANDVEQFYKNSLINIISETNFFTPEIHLNEKTYKPIAFKQPFIMIGAPRSLQHLKDVGFKTFDLWWDESYDLETDNVKRMQMINALVEEIASWSAEKKIQFTHEVKDIVEFNCEHLATMSHPEITAFEEKYGN